MTTPSAGRLPATVGGCSLFAYGTLQFPAVLRALLGRVPSLEPARLRGWRAAALPQRVYPGLVAAEGASTCGVVISDLTGTEWAIIDAFEDDEYDLRPVRVEGRVELIQAYVWTARAEPGEWCRDDFAADYLERFAGRWERFGEGRSSSAATPPY